MNLFIARRTDCPDTPICRAISASVNLLVDVIREMRAALNDVQEAVGTGEAVADQRTAR
jgi:hypothetical protein